MKKTTGIFNREASSQTEKAYATLEELIVTGVLPPGSQWSEIALSERIGLGRSPTRAALQKLSFQRLVYIAPREGIFIPEIDYPGQLKILQVRREIEKVIISEAAQCADDEEREGIRHLIKQLEVLKGQPDMHEFMRVHFELTQLLSGACRNTYAAEYYSMLQTLARRFLFFHQDRFTSLSTICDLHIRLLQAVVDGAVQKAFKAAAARNGYAESTAREILMEMINSSALTVRVNSLGRSN